MNVFRPVHAGGLAWRVPELFAREGRGVDVSPIDRDLPPLVDPVTTLPATTRIVTAASVVLVLLTGGHHVGPGFTQGDLVLLLAAYVIATLIGTSQRIAPFDGRRFASVLAIQLLFVVSLTTMTGGGDSPYVALYAPILAIAGWHLRPMAYALTVATITILEVWRAYAVDIDGGVDQVLISIPLYAALGLLAAAAANWLTAALLTIRRDQARTDSTLAAVHGLATSPTADPLAELAMTAERVFGVEATIIPVKPWMERRTDLATGEDERSVTVAVAGADQTYAILHASRSTPLGTNERRLIGILAGVTGRTLDTHPAGLRYRLAADVEPPA